MKQQGQDVTAPVCAAYAVHTKRQTEMQFSDVTVITTVVRLRSHTAQHSGVYSTRASGRTHLESIHMNRLQS
jgi:hypothetical protein